MANLLATTLERGTIRIGYTTAGFEPAVRGLLVPPLLERGISPSRVDEIVESVLRREEAGSTSSGAIALPHARISGVSGIVAGLGVNASGIYPNAGTRVMLAFVSPAEAAGEHLRFLSLVAKTFRDAPFLQRVQSAGTREELLALFTDSEPPSR
jgi:mannitol/fructose-specific phosphotransferase system IIA component (Ntr-type)